MKAQQSPDDPKAQGAFETIKELITGEQFLVNPDWTKPIQVYTDASEHGVGAVIKQDHGIITYYGKTFTNTEKNWSIYKKEMYAIRQAIKDNINYLRIYTPGMVEVYCDNQAVVQKLNSMARDEKIEKQALSIYQAIIDYGLIIKHISGKENSLADALSRYKENIKKIADKQKGTHDRNQGNNTKEINSITTTRSSMMLNKKKATRRERYKQNQEYNIIQWTQRIR